MKEINYNAKVLDTRDLESRIQWLINTDDIKIEYQEELLMLEEVKNNVSRYNPDWKKGITLIEDNYFEKYVQEQAEKSGLLIKEPDWPYNHIDWISAAKEIRMNYQYITIGCNQYWYLLKQY